MLAIATDPDHLDALGSALARTGASIVEVTSPTKRRRVVLATVPASSAEPAAVALRADGWMAVARPDDGAALAAWHDRTRPVVVDGRLTICLAWSEHDRAELPGLIELGPGGFGSGHHPTTRMLLEVMADRIEAGDSVLDVGCGSGVLALAALGLGAGSVVGVDLKPEAVAATEQNGRHNGLGGRLTATSEPLAALPGVFDVVVANIARAGIVDSAPSLVAKLAPKGWLAVSGITPAQVDVVSGHVGLSVAEVRTDGEWAAVIFERS